MDLRTDGFAIFENVLSRADVALLQAAVAAIPDGESVRRRPRVYGVRNLFEVCPPVRRLAADPRVRDLVEPVLGEVAFAVRATFFDKAPGTPWSLGWHQDSVVSVRERVDTPGFVAWANKAGVWQAQPPVDVMAGMLAVRLHLDDCRATNGALRVLPGSHRYGWLDDRIQEWRANVSAVTCEVAAGDALAMRPLLLHASARSVEAGHRRVIHLEFADRELPGALRWRHRIGRA